MARTILTPIDLNQNEIRNAAAHNLAAAPSSPVPGQWYFNTGDGKMYYWDGDSWELMGSGGTGGDADTLEGNDSAYHLDRTNHTGTQNAATISDLAATVQAYRLDQFAAPTASVSLNSQLITNLLDPTSAQDAATKAYVDAVAQGLEVKESVRAAAASLDANTRTGNVLTADNPGLFNDTSPGGLSDWQVGQSLLLLNEFPAENRGIYTVTDMGSGGTPWVLTRRADADSSAEVRTGMYAFVDEGTYAGAGFSLTTTGTITLNTTGLTFSQFNGAGQIAAGDGLTKSGNSLAVGAGFGILVNADDIEIDPDSIPRKYSQAIGDGSSTQITVTHGLNTRNVLVELVTNSGNYPTVEADVERTGVNTVRITFATAPTTDQYLVIIQG